MKNHLRIMMITGSLMLLVLILVVMPSPPSKVDAQAIETDSGILQVDVPVRGTYLRAIDYWPYSAPGTSQYDEDLDIYIETSGLYRVEQPVIVDLEANGFAENDKIMIKYTGTMNIRGAWGGSDPNDVWKDEDIEVLALFSATPELKPITERYRVPGAIDYGEDVNTGHTYWAQDWEDLANKLASKGIIVDRGDDTDIPEDFRIAPYSGMSLQIPKGAKYLFLCPKEIYYADNTGSLTVTITKKGFIEDGSDHELAGVEVTLLSVSPESSSTIAVTLTDEEGGYAFGGIEDGDYQVEVALELHQEVGDTPLFSVNYDTETSSVRAKTETFKVTDGTVARDITFADPDLVPAAGIPKDRLGVLALSYYRGKQVIDFEYDQLAVNPDLNLPIVIHEFTSDGNKAFYIYNESSPDRGDIFIGDIAAAMLSLDRPMNLEWHEMFHELMDDTINVPEPHVGDNNHKGFANHCTGDSWVEGWADAWSSLLKRYVGGTDWRSPDWWVYEWEGGVLNLEENIRVWESEEDAVAGLLIDLIDPVEPLDSDWITLNNNQLWQIIGTHTLQDMLEVYWALQDHGIGQIDSNKADLPLNDLDALFVAHGFFADDGDHVYELGEAVGFGGKVVGGVARTNKPTDPAASIRIRVTDDTGAPESGATLLVNVVFPGDQSIYNYSYTEKLPSGDEQLGFYVAPAGTEATINLQVRSESGTLSGTYSVSNIYYWQKVSESTTGYAAEHTFVIGEEEKTTVAWAPVITSIDTLEAHIGKTATFVLMGTDLSGATELDFGSGITVQGFTVDSATQITVEIEVSSNAEPGARDVTVTTPRGVFTLTDAFTVKETSSGNVSVWIWLIAGMVVVAAGVGGFLLYRRRAKPV